MNTDTGRIYTPEEMKRLMGFVDDDPSPRELDARIGALEEGVREQTDRDLSDLIGGRVVPVSEEVVQKVRLGERELKRRARRRKASREARRKNR